MNVALGVVEAGVGVGRVRGVLAAGVLGFGMPSCRKRLGVTESGFSNFLFLPVRGVSDALDFAMVGRPIEEEQVKVVDKLL